MSYLVWEMWTSPTYEVGESKSPGASLWWQEEYGGLFVQASAFPLALPAVLLYKRSIFRGGVGLGPSWFCTQSERPCAPSVLAHQAPLAVALAGGCAVQRSLGSAVMSSDVSVCFKMVGMWKLAVSQGFCWAVGEF